MKTVKMTRAQLREAIIKKRGEEETREVLDYLRDMNAAIVLLRELPKAFMDYKHGEILWSGILGLPYHEAMVRFEIGNEAEAIACAWWQWKTGEIVELVNE